MDTYQIEKSLEFALNNVVTHVGTDYYQPAKADEYVNNVLKPGDRFRNPYYGLDKSPVKFEKGTAKDLNAWLTREKDKYPVVWLVYPTNESARNEPKRLLHYKGAVLVFAVNRELKELIDNSLNVTSPMLRSIVERFFGLMYSSFFKDYIWMDRTKDYTLEWFPNRATTAKKASDRQDENVTVDIWDTYTLTCDLFLRPECVKPLPETDPDEPTDEIRS